jgi:hypothetical protein
MRGNGPEGPAGIVTNARGKRLVRSKGGPDTLGRSTFTMVMAPGLEFTIRDDPSWPGAEKVKR